MGVTQLTHFRGHRCPHIIYHHGHLVSSLSRAYYQHGNISFQSNLSVFTDSSHGNIGTMSYSAFIVTTCLSVSLTTDHAPKLPPFAANTTRHTHVAPHGPATATPAPPATLSVRAEPLSVCFLHQARRAHGFLPEAAEHLKCQLP